MTSICSLAIFILLMFATVASSQKIPGNVMSKVFSSEEDLESMTISSDGKYAIVEFTDRIYGISIADGTTVWTRKLKNEYERKGNCITWTNPHEATIPTEAGLEWIDVETGKSLAVVPFLGEGLSDLDYESGGYQSGFWSVRARRIGQVEIVPFEGGYQIFDLRSRKELYRSTEELSGLRIEYWGSAILIYGDMDTGVVVDVDEPRVLAEHAMEGQQVDPQVYQNLFRHKDQLAIFSDDNVVCYNVQSRARIGLLGFEPKEMTSYSAILLKDSICFITQDEEYLRLYNVGTARNVWSVNTILDVRGTLAYAWPLPNGDILAEFVDDEDQISLAKINASTGAIKWDKRFVQSSGEFASGHWLPAPFQLKIATKAQRSNLGYRPVRSDSLDRQTYYSQMAIDSGRPYEEWQFVDMMNTSFVHEASKAVGIIRYLGTFGNEILVKSCGNVRKAWDGKTSDYDYDAEGLIRIDLETGNVKSFLPIPFYQHLGNEDKDVTRSGIPTPTEHGTVILGTHTAVLLRTNGEVDTIGFPVKEEGALFIFDFGKDYVTLGYEDDDEYHFAWKVSLLPSGLRKELMGVSDTEGTLLTFNDTTFVPVSLRFKDGNLEGYPVMSDVPKQWPKPLWTIGEQQLDVVDLGGMIWDASGIFPYKDVVYVLGGSGLGVVDPATGCFNSIPWEGFNRYSPLIGSLKLFGYKLPNGAVFDLGDDIGLVKIGPGCEMKLIGYSNENRSDLMVVYSVVSSTLMTLDKVENRLDVYQIK